jgi:hypothetical protein
MRVTRRAPTAPRCPACDRSLDAHNLDEMRRCSAELAKREPSYCRLTGPTRAQLELWREAQQRRMP